MLLKFQKIFSKNIPKFNQNKFINKSIYDLKQVRNMILLTAEVCLHTNDPERAFKKLASLVKPGGYLIYGMVQK